MVSNTSKFIKLSLVFLVMLVLEKDVYHYRELTPHQLESTFPRINVQAIL